MNTLEHVKRKYIIAGGLSIIGCLLMVIFPELTLSSAAKGITLWGNSVLPALLPFFICANFMIAIGIPNIVGTYFEYPFKKIFKAPGSGAFIFIISITSGYPMGAKIIGDMTRRGELTLGEAKKLLAMCTTSGPLFMLGAVGVGMLGSPEAGAVIAISHYAGAIINGFFFRETGSTDISRLSPYKGVSAASLDLHGNILEIFTDAILSALKTLGIICGYIVLFTLVTDFLDLLGMHFLHLETERALFKGIFEMTVGCNSIAEITTMSLHMKCILATVLISFGGLSIAAQSMSVLGKTKISVWYYMKVKLLHAAFSGLCAALCAPFFLNDSVTTMVSPAMTSQDIGNMLGFSYQLIFSTKMIIMIIVLFIITMLLNNIGKGKGSDENSSSHS